MSSGKGVRYLTPFTDSLPVDYGLIVIEPDTFRKGKSLCNKNLGGIVNTVTPGVQHMEVTRRSQLHAPGRQLSSVYTSIIVVEINKP